MYYMFTGVGMFYVLVIAFQLACAAAATKQANAKKEMVIDEPELTRDHCME